MSGALGARMKVKKGRPLDNWVPGDTPVVNITGFTANPIIGVPDSGFDATAVDTEFGNMEASLQWRIESTLEIAATAGAAEVVISGAPAGTVVPLSVSATYDVDVTFEDGGLQTLAVALLDSDDYDGVAAKIDAAVSDGSVAFAGGSFVFTDDGTGATSTVLVAAGTTGSGGGDLFAAITAQAGGNPAVVFAPPIDGEDTILPETVLAGVGANPTLTFLVLGAQDVVAFVVDGGVTGSDTVVPTVVTPEA